MRTAAKKTCPELVEWKRNPKIRRGFSLVELLVVIGIIAALVGLSMPMINAMQKSYNSTGTESMIISALATARTLAISNHTYAGVRFQKAWKSTDDANKADQYMIFIIYDNEKTKLVNGFMAEEGYKPMKLPSNIGVIDMNSISLNTDIDDKSELLNATSFSIVFSPAGRLVVRDVQIRNKDGQPKMNDTSKDDVFNTEKNVNDGKAMFIQDDYPNYGLNEEQSRRALVIYNRDTFNTIPAGNRFTGYLENLPVLYINPYTGALINSNE